MHIKISHLLHPGITGPGHRRERMRQKRRQLRPVRPSHKNELWYRAELHKLVKYMRKRVQEHLLPTLKGLWPGPQATDGAPLVATDSPGEASARAAVKATAREFGGIQRLADRLSFGAAVRNLDEVDERLAKAIEASVSVNVRPFLAQNPRIRDATHAAVRTNVDLIKSIPDQYFDKITDAVERNWAGGGRWENLVDRIEEIGDVTENRAALIARDQTSKMTGAFNQIRQTDLGIEKYIWETSEDERVRDSHAEVDGQEFRWDEPGPVAGSVAGEPCHPQEDISCRCVGRPVFDLDAMEAELGFSEAA